MDARIVRYDPMQKLWNDILNKPENIDPKGRLRRSATAPDSLGPVLPVRKPCLPGIARVPTTALEKKVQVLEWEKKRLLQNNRIISGVNKDLVANNQRLEERNQVLLNLVNALKSEVVSLR